MTLQTIAERVGVSRMTVSNAFSRPDQLSADLRRRILDVADELGYVGPDPSARALARGKVGAIGVLLTDSLSYAFTDDVATRLLAAISEELGEAGYALTLLRSSGVDGFVPARDIPMDGALVHSCNPESDAVDWLRSRKLPLVFVDQPPVKGYPCINVEDRGGARAAAQHAVDLGHRRFALVVSLSDRPAGPIELAAVARQKHSVRERAEGWCEPIDAVGATTLTVNAPRSLEQAGYDAAQAIVTLARDERPTAVLAYSDRIAAGVIAAAIDAGLSVPGDLTVIGFDDASFAAALRPPLTTVRQDVAAKGRDACRLLTAAIASGEPQRSLRKVLPTELVVRASSAPPPR